MEAPFNRKLESNSEHGAITQDISARAQPPSHPIESDEVCHPAGPQLCLLQCVMAGWCKKDLPCVQTAASRHSCCASMQLCWWSQCCAGALAVMCVFVMCVSILSEYACTQVVQSTGAPQDASEPDDSGNGTGLADSLAKVLKPLNLGGLRKGRGQPGTPPTEARLLNRGGQGVRFGQAEEGAPGELTSVCCRHRDSCMLWAGSAGNNRCGPLLCLRLLREALAGAQSRCMLE